MSSVAHALQGECLDALVWRATGRGSGAVEAVLGANPGLADTSTALAEGRAVTIPDLAAAPVSIDQIQLWD